MNFCGNIVQIYRDYGRRKWMITLETDQDITEEYERLKDKVVSVVVKLFRKSRSLNANAYYWQLLGKICEVTGENAAYRHNMNLRECGYIELIDGQAVYVVIPDTEEAEKKVDAYESVHLKPTSQIKGGKDGKLYRTYMMLRGSHTFDTKEMSRLIDIVIGQAKDLGIETATPDQIAEMLQKWGVKIGEET